MPKAKKLPSGSWRCQVFSHEEIWFDDDGNKHVKKVRESFTASTKKEAEFMAAEFLLTKNKKVSISDLTLFEAINKYIENRSNVLSPTTISGYKNIQKNGFQDIMYVPLKKLTQEKLQEAVNAEANRKSSSTRNKGTISAKTVKNNYGLVRAVLKEYEPNLNTSVKLPAVQKVIKELLPPEVIFQAFKGTEIELPVLMSMWMSFSMSELRGIKKSEIVDGYLTIRRTIVDVDGEAIEKNSTKAYDRTRKHKLPRYIRKLVDECETDYICPYSCRALYSRFSRRLEELGLPHMSFHDLRHVSASVMHMLNVPDKYAMERGGWSSDHIMKSVYTHTFSSERRHIDNVIDGYFDGVISGKSRSSSHESSHETEKRA